MAEKRIVHYKAALDYINAALTRDDADAEQMTDSGLRSRISRGTIPVEPPRPLAGTNRRTMFDLDKIDLWLRGAWRKGQ